MWEFIRILINNYHLREWNRHEVGYKLAIWDMLEEWRDILVDSYREQNINELTTKFKASINDFDRFDRFCHDEFDNEFAFDVNETDIYKYVKRLTEIEWFLKFKLE